jgi:hypothetical protein
VNTYVSRAPGTRMGPGQRVSILLAERAALGRPLVFTEVPSKPHVSVHVLGPDEDQPAYSTIRDYDNSRRVRTVCGIDIRRPALHGTIIGTFDIQRICRTCWHAFGRYATLIMDDNTAPRQEAASIIATIRRSKRPSIPNP